MERASATRYPLYWPAGWPRTPAAKRERSRFQRGRWVTGRGFVGTLTVYSASQDVLAELERLGAGAPVISTNLRTRADGIPASGQKRPADPGAAVWFDLEGHSRVLACDRWETVEENLRAIALHIEALRGIDRWGVGSVAQAFSAYHALPARAGGRGWREVLGFLEVDYVTRADVDRAYRRLAHDLHPDKGGDAEGWHELQAARNQALEAVPA